MFPQGCGLGIIEIIVLVPFDERVYTYEHMYVHMRRKLTQGDSLLTYLKAYLQHQRKTLKETLAGNIYQSFLFMPPPYTHTGLYIKNNRDIPSQARFMKEGGKRTQHENNIRDTMAVKRTSMTSKEKNIRN